MDDSVGEGGFVIWNCDCFVDNSCGIFSWYPCGPMEVDIELLLADEGCEHAEFISFGVHADEDDACTGSKGEYGRSGKSCAGEVGVRRHCMDWGDEASSVVSMAFMQAWMAAG